MEKSVNECTGRYSLFNLCSPPALTPVKALAELAKYRQDPLWLKAKIKAMLPVNIPGIICRIIYCILLRGTWKVDLAAISDFEV